MSEEKLSPEQESERLLEEAEALIWGLLDENIDSVSLERLQRLLEDQEVRKRYVQCVELHADLQELFQPTTQSSEGKPSTPVLGSLGDVFKLPGMGGAVDETPLTE